MSCMRSNRRSLKPVVSAFTVMLFSSRDDAPWRDNMGSALFGNLLRLSLCHCSDRATRVAASLTSTLKLAVHFDNPKYSEEAVWLGRRMARIQLTELSAFVAV